MQRILFVCTGNTCRSPMAEAILRHKKIDGMEVRSAGIYAAHGSEASAHAKQVLDDNKVAHNHRSTLLTNQGVDWADLILTMTSSHKFSIQQQYPHSTTKVFTLKEYTGEPFDHDVIDPYGGNLAQYKETFNQLDKLIEKAIGKINS
ncbi:low molecular weight protein arginine phosphatase [Neobacillus sp. NRS-1170]|uniref:low molecular weight protein arginine phosphatase n=1 Tax=Neobacillus sp. NRS-1170 TaxID=3233898 RepID=UPI003D2A0126